MRISHIKQDRSLRGGKNGSRFTGSVKAEKHLLADDDWKVCSSCKEKKQGREFGIREMSTDMRDYYCKVCRKERQKKIYDFRKDTVRYNRWKRLRGDTLLTMTEELLHAAEQAATTAMFRGKDGLQSLMRLKRILDVFSRELEDDIEDLYEPAPDCTCGVAWPCKRHMDEYEPDATEEDAA